MNTMQPIIKKSWFIQSNNQSIQEKYSFGKKLGEGAYGAVYKVSLIGTDITRAVKIINKQSISQPIRLINQINFMKQLDHPNLVKLYETYETEMDLFLVMEYCAGGDILDRLSHRKILSEKQAKSVLRDIVRAVSYLHSNNVCHRDLKPQNFIFLNDSTTSTLKLTDFGLSTMARSSVRMKSLVGTIYYISPEVFQGNYEISCDIWALGIILIVLLTGQIPIQGKHDCQIINNIKSNRIIIPKNISITVRNLIKKCIKPPRERIQASQILEHPWLIETKKPFSKPKISLSKLEQFNIKSHLKKIVLTIIASQVKSNDIEEISKLFKNIDTNNDGVLSQQEIINCLHRDKKFRNSEKEVRKIISGIDTDRNGNISYTQFLTVMIDERIYMKPDYLKLAFSIIDRDSNGTIQFYELKELMVQGQSDGKTTKLIKQNEEYEQEWERLLLKLDKNGDGRLSFDQFLKIFED